MNIYVGNLSPETEETDLRKAFEPYGQVTRAHIIVDKITSLSKGFGFVDMAVEDEGRSAMTGLAGKELQGRAIKMSEARRLSEVHPRKPNQPDSGYRDRHGNQ